MIALNRGSTDFNILRGTKEREREREREKEREDK